MMQPRRAAGDGGCTPHGLCVGSLSSPKARSRSYCLGSRSPRTCWSRDWRLLGRLHLGAGLLLVAVVAVPWLVAAELRNPGFLHFFFVREHWERFTQPSHQRTGPLWYFIPIGAVLLMPWLPALLRIRPWRDCPRSNALGFNPVRFAWYWAAAVVLFFSLSSSKLPPYILPALAGVALAAAPALARHWRHTVRISAWTIVASGIVGAVVIIRQHVGSRSRRCATRMSRMSAGCSPA